MAGDPIEGRTQGRRWHRGAGARLCPKRSSERGQPRRRRRPLRQGFQLLLLPLPTLLLLLLLLLLVGLLGLLGLRKVQLRRVCGILLACGLLLLLRLLRLRLLLLLMMMMMRPCLALASHLAKQATHCGSTDLGVGLRGARLSREALGCSRVGKGGIAQRGYQRVCGLLLTHRHAGRGTHVAR
jgi:hypothetical protein